MAATTASSQLLGGKPTPGIGFGLGLDRVALVLAEQGSADARSSRARSPSSWAPTRTTRWRGCGSRRTSGRRACASARTSRAASSGASSRPPARTGAHFAVILGDELATGQVQVRDLLAGTQRTVALEDLARELARAEAAHKHG